MASQTAKTEAPKRGIKNPWIYGGTVVVFIIVVVAFVFVPAFGGSYAKSGAPTFGSYAGKPITFTAGNYFARQVQSIYDSLRQQGIDQSGSDFYAYQIYRGAFERTVKWEGILDAVRSAGAIATPATLDQRMAEYSAFLIDGKFSARLYKEATMAEKASIRASIEEEILSNYYYSEVYALAPSSKEVEFVKAMAKETRTIEYVAFPLAAYPDSEVAAWAAAHADKFRGLSLSRVTADDEATAKKLLARARKGESFAELAKSSSKDSWAQAGGSLGIRRFHELESDLSDPKEAAAIAALPKDGISEIMKTSAGSFAFFKADGETVAADFTDPAMLKSVRGYMERSERGTIEDWSAGKAEAFAASAAGGFKASASKAGLEVKSAGPFPLNYGDISVSLYGQTLPLFKTVAEPGDSSLADASRSEAFLKAAFSLAPGAVSEPIVLGDKVIVLTVKEAGSALEEDLSSIALYYPYFMNVKTDADIGATFLASPKLRDKFMDAYFTLFAPRS
jgi:hypothetical protein